MNTQDLIRQGDLTRARQSAVDDVKASPGDSGKRFLLFQILAFLGEWDKAKKHLDFMQTQNPEQAGGIQTYRNLLQAEKSRQELWRGSDLPDFLPEKPSYAPIYADFRRKLSRGETAEARTLLENLLEQLPDVQGQVGGKAVSGFQETDSVLSVCLEAFVYEKYVWVPFSEIRELSIEAPKTLIDLLWSNARLTTWAGLTLNCLLPVLYPDSHKHPDDLVKLGRMTDWVELGDGLVRGVGQHVYAAGESDLSLLEIGEVSFFNKG